jgi:DNA-binding NtrC family response regulator
MVNLAGVQSRVLIVDDDPEMLEALDLVFSASGHGCELARNAATALEVVARQTLDVVVSDVRMEGMSGLELLDRVSGRRTLHCPSS